MNDTRAATMRAVVQDRYGDAGTLQVADVPRPDLEADQVLVEVHAAGIDRGVWHLMTGMPYLVRLAGYGITRPKQPIPGLDLSGTVAAVGADVTRFAVGDRVFGIGSGTYAEFAVADESKLSHIPSGVDMAEAAVSAISGITALQALTDVGRLDAGQLVLVIGASGGVGSWAVRLASALGGRVTGVASGSKAEFVRSLGADTVLDYRADDYLDGSARYDLIIDTGGLNPVRRLRRALTARGTLVIVGGEGGGRITGGIGRQLRAMALSPFVGQRLTSFISSEDHAHIERLAEFMADGGVPAPIGAAYPLDDVPQALADLAAGRITGKAVVEIRTGE